ncbi:hypothetical protein MMC07_001445 [Pseudocyphellaria aurata]|nr:hypothetical protein [Pseudocyphellaria aurata]
MSSSNDNVIGRKEYTLSVSYDWGGFIHVSIGDVKYQLSKSKSQSQTRAPPCSDTVSEHPTHDHRIELLQGNREVEHRNVSVTARIREEISGRAATESRYRGQSSTVLITDLIG